MESTELHTLVRQIEYMNNKIDMLLNRLNEQSILIDRINSKVNPEKPKKDTLRGRIDFKVKKSVSKYITQ